MCLDEEIRESIEEHPLNEGEIVDAVLKSWETIFETNIGKWKIGKDIVLEPQAVGVLLHQLVARYLNEKKPEEFTIGKAKDEKDIHCKSDEKFSVEIKTSSSNNKIFGNRSYAQENAEHGKKGKDGFYLAINFEKMDDYSGDFPEIKLIRFGYLTHEDWQGQKSETGQQASLPKEVYKRKLKELYRKD